MPVSNSLSNLNDSTKKIGRKFLGLAQYKPQKLSAIRDKVAKVSLKEISLKHINSIKQVKNKLTSNIAQNSSKVLKKSAKGIRVLLQYSKNIVQCGRVRGADKKIKKFGIKINNSFGYVIPIIWLILIGYLTSELQTYYGYIKHGFSSFLDVITIFISLPITVIIAVLLFRDIRGIICLKKIDKTQIVCENLVQTDETEELKKYLLLLDGAKKHQRKLKNEFKNIENAKEVAATYERIVLKTQDGKINKVINKYSLEAVLGNAISDLSILDFLASLYCFYRMLLQIVKIYQIKLGISSILRILATGCVICYMSSKKTNFLSKFVKKIIPDGIYKGIVDGLIQAFAAGGFIFLYGHWLKKSLRPINYYDEGLLEETLKDIPQKEYNKKQ